MLIKKVIGFMILALVLLLSLSRCEFSKPESEMSSPIAVNGSIDLK